MLRDQFVQAMKQLGVAGVMSEREAKEREITFYAGMSAMWMLMSRELEQLPEDEAVKAMDQIEEELNEYWKQYED